MLGDIRKTIRESITRDDYELLCEEIRDMLTEEFGEHYVQIIDASALLVSLNPEQKKRYGVHGAELARKDVVAMVKNTMHTVTGEHSTDISTTSMKVFEISGVRAAVTIYDHDTLYVRVVLRLGAGQ